VSVVISDEILQTARLSADELKQEIAILLFEKNRLTLGQASRVAEMSQLRFQHLLASLGIPVHYGIEDFEADVATLRDLGRL